jgi:hypothetical protein
MEFRGEFVEDFKNSQLRLNIEQTGELAKSISVFIGHIPLCL